MKHYELQTFDQAQKLNYPAPWGESWDEVLRWIDGSWTSGVWRFVDDFPVEYIGDDNCEPEDALLYRSFSWVVDALNQAYELGRSVGIVIGSKHIYGDS